jgi:MFS family permease
VSRSDPGDSRRGAFARLWAATGVSLAGDQVTTLALPLIAVLTLHADATDVGLLSASRLVPFLLGSLLIGAYVDRMRRRPLLIGADLVRGVALLAVVVSAVTGLLSLAWLIALVVVVGSLTVLADVATQSYLVDLVPPDDLVAANSRLQVTRAGTQIGGPAVGGVLISALGAPLALLADAVSFLLSAALTVSIRAPERVRATPRQGTWSSIREGLALTYRQPVLRALAVTAGHSNIVEQGLMVLLAVRFVGEQGNSAAALGLALGAGAGGAAVSGLATTWLCRRQPAGRVMLGGEILAAGGLAGTAVVTTAADTPTALLVVTLAVFGLGEGIGNVLYAAVRQGIVPADLQGRAYGSYRLVVSGTTPAGPLIAGGLAGALGSAAALLVLAVLAVLIPFWLLAGSIRRLRLPATEAAPAGQETGAPIGGAARRSAGADDR